MSEIAMATSTFDENVIEAKCSADAAPCTQPRSSQRHSLPPGGLLVRLADLVAEPDKNEPAGREYASHDVHVAAVGGHRVNPA